MAIVQIGVVKSIRRDKPSGSVVATVRVSRILGLPDSAVNETIELCISKVPVSDHLLSSWVTGLVGKPLFVSDKETANG